jgi:hypothetical protein
VVVVVVVVVVAAAAMMLVIAAVVIVTIATPLFIQWHQGLSCEQCENGQSRCQSMHAPVTAH